MDFDPLSLFTPEIRDDDNEESGYLESNSEKSCPTPVVETINETADDDDDEETHLHPLHILDLPLLQLHPPAEVLLTVLKLLAPNEVFNFAPPSSIIEDTEEELDCKQVFSDKGLEESVVESALEWLKKFCPRLDNCLKLALIPQLSESLKRNHESDYNAYITRIISSDLQWIDSEDTRDKIHKESSLRISENCGRTAQPEIIRKIAIPNLSNYLKNDCKYIQLKEPSLTSDNLGLKTWGSSLILANRLVNKNNGYLVDDVLELGSGTGLVGIICSVLGFNTFVTDLAEIIPNLKVNVDLNSIDAKVHELNWCDPKAFTETFGNEISFKTIVVSDPVYSSKHPYWVVNMINKFLSKDNDSRVLIQIPLRPKFEEERAVLWGLMEESSFNEVEHEIENGFDDFGKMKFCFKLYNRKN
ncbi:putative methyltransferase-domain-containing protein [Scheffersomyces xylosifermentans]|uniref:putative methyltransferase-domain-containing protein n=1 Tax=Scheffersomyces xylosifermentans TaxID=1304137 RepID=UPI00315CE164